MLTKHQKAAVLGLPYYGKELLQIIHKSEADEKDVFLSDEDAVRFAGAFKGLSDIGFINVTGADGSVLRAVLTEDGKKAVALLRGLLN